MKTYHRNLTFYCTEGWHVFLLFACSLPRTSGLIETQDFPSGSYNTVLGFKCAHLLIAIFLTELESNTEQSFFFFWDYKSTLVTIGLPVECFYEPLCCSPWQIQNTCLTWVTCSWFVCLMSVPGFSVAQSIQSEYHLIVAINPRPRKPQTRCFFSIMYQCAVSRPSGQFENAEQLRHSKLSFNSSTSSYVLLWCCVKAEAFLWGGLCFVLFEMKPRATGAPSVTPLSLPFLCLFFSKGLRSGFQTWLLITCSMRCFVWHAEVLPYFDSLS